MRRPVLILIALAVAGACSSSGGKKDDPAVSTSSTSSTVTTHQMTFEECQKSGEYPGGRYAVEYDNGVCKVQKPAAAETTATTAAPATTVTALSFASCADAKAAGYSSMRKGEPGYSTKLDRDGDGVACDT